MIDIFTVTVTSRQGIVVAVTADRYSDELEAVVLEGVRRWLQSRQPAAKGTTSELTVMVQA